MNELKLEDIFEKIAEISGENKNKNYVRLPIQRNQELLKTFFENIIKDDGFVCGGFGRVSVSKNKDLIPSMDLDIYTKGKDQFEAISKRLELAGYYEFRKSETARTMHYSFKGALPVQLIMPLNEGNVLLSSENVEDILNNFDFSIARVAITKESFEKNEAIADVDFEKDDARKHLNIKNIHCPVAQVYRLSKYMEKGFWAPIIQIVKVLEDWENRGDEYKSKIRDTIMKEDPTQEEIQELEKLLHID
jgi:hypothetical protein